MSLVVSPSFSHGVWAYLDHLAVRTRLSVSGNMPSFHFLVYLVLASAVRRGHGVGFLALRFLLALQLGSQEFDVPALLFLLRRSALPVSR